MRVLSLRAAAAAVLTLTMASVTWSAPPRARGWLNWRGPQQNGVSSETGLPDTWAVGGANHLWSLDVSGRGAPVIANGRLYAIGYTGEGAALREVVICADAATGKKLWERYFSDFISDIIYDRYSIGSPTVDPETGNVYVLTSPGIFACFTPDGKTVWQHSLMEKLGRLTFPNGRTGSAVIDGDLVIIRAITSNWGGEGPAMDRFYAFEKQSGHLVWSSSPGAQPRDNSFAPPTLAWRGAQRVFYTGTGCGFVVCVNARTGEPIWRYAVSQGGVNSAVVLHRNKAIAIHDAENVDTSEIGRMTAVRTDVPLKPAEAGPSVLDKSAEAWRNDLGTFSSSPVLAGDRIYQVTSTGFLCSVDANTGKVLWRQRLGPDQLHASPLYADGKLYVPLQNGSFHIVRPSDTGIQELAKVQLEGNCLGAPVAWAGRIYVHTTKKLYCFGKKTGGKEPAPLAAPPAPKPGKTVALQVIPAEILVHPGEKVRFAIRGIDANGHVTQKFDPARAKWAKYIPPTARVRSEMNASFDARGELTADPRPVPSAGAFEATIDGLKGYIRGRILPALPLREDFQSFEPTVPDPMADNVKFAYPPLPWIGARFRWDIRDVEGERVLAKTLDNVLFQRAITYIGHPEMKGYTVEADVMTDGNRRIMSTVGVINQRYLISLLGNSQELEISSNQERLKASVPFAWQPKVWYRLKTRVDVAPDGSGMVRARVWKRGEAEPAAWTLEVPHAHAHASGSPGLFGFAPQSKFAVYIDNVSVLPN